MPRPTRTIGKYWNWAQLRAMSPPSLVVPLRRYRASLLCSLNSRPLSTEVQAWLWKYEVNSEVSPQAFFLHGCHGDGKILCSGGIMGI